MKKFSRNVAVVAIFGAAGIVAATAVPASAASVNDTSATSVHADTTTSVTTKAEARKVWEW